MNDNKTRGICLVIKKLEKIYQIGKRRQVALSNINLEIKQGELIAIVGPSGSGKTTLLNLIGGLVKSTNGEILLNGTDLTKLSQRDFCRLRREQIGFVFQNYNIVPYLSVINNLLLVAHLNKQLNQVAREKARDLLAEFDLLDRAQDLPDTLSGGERQRIAIARAFMNDPAIVLVDEPTAGLDTNQGMKAVKLLHAEIGKRKKTGLMVTHDMRMCAGFDRVIEIVDGRIKRETSNQIIA